MRREALRFSFYFHVPSFLLGFLIAWLVHMWITR